MDATDAVAHCPKLPDAEEQSCIPMCADRAPTIPFRVPAWEDNNKLIIRNTAFSQVFIWRSRSPSFHPEHRRRALSVLNRG